jgi:fimbrial chaperone protein
VTCLSTYARYAARLLGVWMLSLAAASLAAAGSFSVSPIRIELSKGQPTAVMTVRNNDTAPVIIQASTLSWGQPGGEEAYGPTRELLVTPPIFTLPPDGEQIVRVALRREPEATRELAYRLLLAEVPQAADKEFTGLRVALRLSLPVFVRPMTPAKPEVEWHATWTGENQLQVTAANSGTAHLQVTDFELRFPGVEVAEKVAVSRYVLPGSAITWEVKVPAEVSRTASVAIHGFSDSGEFQAETQITGP